jgi:Zn-dependent protease with chaperone function
MPLANPVRKHLFKAFVQTLASLFAIPLIALVFSHYVLASQDAAFLQSVETEVAADSRLSPEEQRHALAWYHARPLSSACDDNDPKDKEFHDKACEEYSMRWQFYWTQRAAVVAMLLGATLLVTVLALAALAFVNRGLRYASFVAGWRLMTAASAVEVVLQSSMVVWLSFWLTAYFFERYSIKLVAIAGIAAGLAAFYAIWMLFKSPPSGNPIEGELVTPGDAPLLWKAVQASAARVKTAAPDHIVAGIDTNFFVTEVACIVQGRTIKGRTLFISIPLLRVLDRQEADAVLAHELAHLGGGDTRSSALLGPKLKQFDEYTWRMHGGGLTLVAHYLLRLYRMIFSFALARDGREREYLADRVAAGLTAPRAIVHSLIKISAYAQYRDQVERRLFAHDRQHGGALGISSFVAEGLHPYATSPDFVDTMRDASVPHPYDSHPPLRERMRNVGFAVEEQHYGAIVTAVPQATWVDDIPVASALESRLWAAYEQRFMERHLHSLAYRYEPKTDEERAVVLRYFPPVVFDLGKGGHITVSYDALHADADGGQPILWDQIKQILYKDSSFGNTAIVTLVDRGTMKSADRKIKLRGMGKQDAAFKAAVNLYWHRHQVMRAQSA